MLFIFSFCVQFSQINGGDELTRERCLKYLQAKLKKIDKELINAEVETYVIDELKKVLQVSIDPFFMILPKALSTCSRPFFMTFLSTYSPKTDSILIDFRPFF